MTSTTGDAPLTVIVSSRLPTCILMSSFASETDGQPDLLLPNRLESLERILDFGRADRKR